MPTVVVASDSFKGSLTSLEVGDAVRLGLLDVAPSAQVVVVPVADGGEGTVAAALAAGWEAVPVMVHGPTGEPVSATLAARRSGSGVTVVVEMADACGLGRLPGGIPAPLTASSRGLGEAVSAALDLGADEVVVGVGGSASTDGGAGLLAALGARLLDAAGADLPDGGAALADLHQLDLSRLDPRLATTALVLAADVDSPLLGPTGAAAVFAPQKGATPDEVAVLEAALTHWSDAVTVAVATSTNRSKLLHPTEPGDGTRSTYWSKLPHPTEPGDGTGSTYWSKLPHPTEPGDGTRSTYWSKLSQQAGAGAAGGVGFALLAVLGAERRSGVDVVLDLVGLEAALAEADLVVTGEGALDEQTLAGKAVSGVARRARASGIRTVAVCGRRTLDDDGLAALGLHAAYPLSDLEPDPQRSIGDAADLLRRTGRRIAQDWLTPAPE
ncbi:MAG: glycerate kinase [Ornithinibacter sp.]